MTSNISPDSGLAPSYDQRGIRAWDGLYGVTGAYERDGNLLIVSQDKFWRWNPNTGFYAKGFLGEAWGTNVPIVDLNTSGRRHSRLQKRPWNYPGVTSIFYFRNATEVFYASRNKYWSYNWGTGSWGAGFLSNLLPGAPPVGGRGPFDGPGLTGSYKKDDVLRLLSCDRMWRYNLTTNQWLSADYLSNSLPGVPAVDGAHPWDAPGVTCAYYYPPFNTTTFISRDKYWEYDYNRNTWSTSGYLRDRWANMPGLDAGWVQPTGGDPSGSWQISQPMGTGTSFGAGHLAHDVQRVEGNDVSVGQEISATAQGKVVTVLPRCGSYYNVVVIEHMVPDIDDTHAPIYSFYGHINAVAGLVEGQWVRRGQVLGTLPDPRGEYGFGAHVHFEVKNWAALVNSPFSTCYTNVPDSQTYGRYISSGYSGFSFTNPSEYYDLPPIAGQSVPRRYYNPTKFSERRGGGLLNLVDEKDIAVHPPLGLKPDEGTPVDVVEDAGGQGV